MSSGENFEKATNTLQTVASYAGKEIGKIYGGPAGAIIGKAYGTFISGQAGLTGSLADSFEKYKNGTLTGEDVADVLLDMAQLTASFGVLAGLAAPWTLTAVGVAGMAVTAYKEYPAARKIANDIANKYFHDGDGSLTDPSKMNDNVSKSFNRFMCYPQRTDPFTLDLDGDGLETVGINSANPLMFDIDATGIKQSIGWIAPDDGLLALDRNGNGAIDSGAELFGDATKLPDGSRAKDGFAAVASLDTNSDGVVDANDAQWSELRVWQDLNQDGISQADELKTMDEAGIASININKTENEVVLDNGNALADLGTFTRTDGTESTTGTIGQLADIDLSVDTFTSQFTDNIPVTAEASSLPDMQGSGQVRDLQQAASMDTAAGHALANILTQYDAATTRDEQLALLDDLIKAWANTSTMATTFTGAYAGHELTVDMQVWYGGTGFEEGGADYTYWSQILTIMERFNGRTYQAVPDGNDPVTLTLWHTPRDLLGASYEELKQSVYDGLLLQTRLEPYIDAIALTVADDYSVGVDFSGITTTFQTRYNDAAGEAVRDLLDLQRISGDTLNSMGWEGYDQLRGWISDTFTNIELDSTTRTQLLSDITTALTDFNYPGLVNNGEGSSLNDLVIGDDAGAKLNGRAGNDLIIGSSGNDILIGGTGSDTLVGGAGNDTYVFNLGDGSDTIVETHGDTDSDILQFGEGISAGDLTITRNGNALLFSHINGTDTISISDWFDSLSNEKHRLDKVVFSDGTSFDLSTLQLGTDEADTLIGVEDGNTTQDLLVGGAGDDQLTGNDGSDWLESL